jgi:hypothetical protein
MKSITELKALAEKAWTKYRWVPGILSIVIEGDPPVGLRYQFMTEDIANSFLVLLQHHNSYDPAIASTLRRDGREIVEIFI